jgi:diguanylate cyclase (GGDEF)-like protein/PAS domain S-box-containing protein
MVDASEAFRMHDRPPAGTAADGPSVERSWSWALLESTGDAFYVIRTRPDLAIEFLSSSITDLVGYTPEEHYADPELPLRIVTAEHRDVVVEVMGSPPGTHFEQELSWTHRDGRTVWSLHKGQVRERADGSVVVEGSGRDITALHETREALAESEFAFRALAENSSDAILRKGPDNRVHYASPSATAMWGWTPEELVGLELTNLWHADDVEAARAALHSGLAHGSYRFRGRVRCRDGSYRWTEMTGRVIQDPHSAAPYGVSTARDIEAQVASELALAASEARFRLLAEHASDMVYLVRADGIVEWMSTSVEPTLGWQPAEVVGTRPWDLVHPDDRERAAAAMASSLESADVPRAFELRMQARDGSYRWVSATGSAILTDGVVTGLVVAMRDVNDEVEARRRLAESEARYRFLVEEGRDVVAIYNPDWSIRWMSPTAARLFDRPMDELRGAAPPTLHPDDIAAMGSMRAAIENGSESVRIRARLRVGDGPYLWTESTARAVRDPDGTVSSIHVITRDVNDQVGAELALASSERRFRLAMLEAPHGMAIVGLDRRFLEVNPALCRILDQDEAWLLARSVTDVLHPDEIDGDQQARRSLVEGGRDHVTQERRFIRSDGSIIWVQHAIALQRDLQGVPLSYVSQMQDVTRVRRVMEELEYQASHDSLTGLLNRHELTDRLELLMSGTAHAESRLAVLFCDLDGLKAINDDLGHAAGDQLLRTTAARIMTSVRGSDTVARVGGDEFVVLLAAVGDEAEAGRVADAIRREVAEPIPFGDGTLATTMSIGVVLAEPGTDVDAVLRAADLALYAAKAAGRDQVAFAVDGVPDDCS